MYPNTSASSRLHKKVRKKREKERSNTHAIKENNRWRANMYHETTPFIALICNKERVHKRGSVTMANNNRFLFLKFPIDI